LADTTLRYVLRDRDASYGAEFCKRVEAIGRKAPEHVVFLERFSSRYPYSRGENIPIPTDTPLLNPFLALT
jgi:hypothetical protein